MKKEKSISNYNFIITGLMVTVFFVIVGLLYDYFFDLNDDVLMKDILSGVFTGSPEGHNIQMQYPISYVISLFYSALRGLDWYGIYLVACQFVSIFIIAKFISGFVKDKKTIAVLGIVSVLSAALLMLGHVVIIQYTFAVGLMCSAAAALIAQDKDKSAAVLIVIAFLTRSEMTMLMLPFVLLVIFYRYIENRKEKGAFKKNLSLCIILVLGIGISVFLHNAGYSDPDWQKFYQFFDSRTDVYDFYQIPDYDENTEFYESIDLSRSEYELLLNYNFGIDDYIDADLMTKIAEYAKEIKTNEPITVRVKRALPLYLYRLRSVSYPKSFEYPMTDAPWNIVTGMLYILFFVLVITVKKYSKSFGGNFLAAAWRLLILFLGRSSLWLFIIVRERDPIRITHSLYLIEIVVLLCLIKICVVDYIEASDIKKDIRNAVKKYGTVFVLAMIVLGAVFIPVQARVAAAETSGRVSYNKAYETLEAYFRDHADSFYYVDVYTSVAYDDSGYTYSQKMFENVDNSAANWIIMGGWASKSPAEEDKLALFDQNCDMETGILKDKSFVVTDKDNNLDWMVDYFRDYGTDVTATCQEEVAGEFTIWEVRENK